MGEAWGAEPRREPGGLVVFDFPLVGWDVDVMAHPELLVAPEPLVPFLAWPGRLTELAGPDKLGKSTLLRQAAIAVATGGLFLGHPLNGPTPARVLWLGLEESLADIWRPMYEMGYRPTERHIGMCTHLSSVDEFHEAVAASARWGLIVVDTLAAFGYAIGIESERDETEMTRVLHVLLDVARAGPAVVVNHHVTKAENPRERGSGAIAATCDVVLTAAARKDDEMLVDVKARGRIPVADFSMRKAGGVFELAPAAVAAAHDARSARVLQLVIAEPDELTANAVAKRLGGDRNAMLDSIKRLLEHGVLMRDNGRLRASGMAGMAGMHTSNTTPSGGGMGGMPPKGGNTTIPYRPPPPADTGLHTGWDDLDRGDAWEPPEPDTTVDNRDDLT